jgi:hypothetical protein
MMNTHHKRSQIARGHRLEQRYAQRTQRQRIRRPLRRKRILRVVHGHGHLDAVFVREVRYAERAPGCTQRAVGLLPAEHVDIALGEPDECDGEVPYGRDEIAPLGRGEELQTRRVSDGDS